MRRYFLTVSDKNPIMFNDMLCEYCAVEIGPRHGGAGAPGAGGGGAGGLSSSGCPLSPRRLQAAQQLVCVSASLQLLWRTFSTSGSLLRKPLQVFQACLLLVQMTVCMQCSTCYESFDARQGWTNSNFSLFCNSFFSSAFMYCGCCSCGFYSTPACVEFACSAPHLNAGEMIILVIFIGKTKTKETHQK